MPSMAVINNAHGENIMAEHDTNISENQKIADETRRRCKEVAGDLRGLAQQIENGNVDAFMLGIHFRDRPDVGIGVYSLGAAPEIMSHIQVTLNASLMENLIGQFGAQKSHDTTDR